MNRLQRQAVHEKLDLALNSLGGQHLLKELDQVLDRAMEEHEQNREEVLERYQQGMIDRAVSMRGRKPGVASFETRNSDLSTVEHVVFRHEGRVVDCFSVQHDGSLKRLKRSCSRAVSHRRD